MAIQHHELFDSGETTIEVGSHAVTLRYVVWGDTDEVAISLYLDANVVADAYLGYPFQSYHMSPQGCGIWFVTVNYADEPPRKVGDFSESFEISNGSRRITHAIQTMHKGKVEGEDGAPPDFKGAIGVTNEGVEGVDIYAGNFTFSITHQFDDAVITNEYRINLARMTPSVNNAPFRGFQPGEVLFLGANGSQRNNQEWEITFRFAAQLNQDDTVFEGSEPFAKDGWDYFWVSYKRTTDQNRHVRQPQFFYVERVYDRTNFSALGIDV